MGLFGWRKKTSAEQRADEAWATQQVSQGGEPQRPQAHEQVVPDDAVGSTDRAVPEAHPLSDEPGEPVAPAASEADPIPADVDETPGATPSPTTAALDAYWSGIGEVDPYVISYVINPSLMGGPQWPNLRQAYRVVRTPSTTILASDGLSDVDPDYPDDGPGLGVEFWLESPGLVGLDHQALRGSWQFRVLENVAQTAAAARAHRENLDHFGVLSTDVPASVLLLDDEEIRELSDYLAEDGSMGLLLGNAVPGRASHVDTPVGDVAMVCVSLLTTGELRAVLRGAPDVRQSIAEAQSSRHGGHFC